MKKISDSEKLKRLQKDFNTLKEETNKEISELKKERRALKAKITNFDTKLSSRANISSEEIEKLKSENKELSENITQLKKKLDATKEDESEEDKRFRIDLSKIYNANLFLYHSGCHWDRWDNLIFDTNNLIIKIHPFSGAFLRSEIYEIAEKIENKDEYKEALKKWEPYKNKRPIEMGTPEAEFLDKLGRSLIPLYISHFIGEI